MLDHRGPHHHLTSAFDENLAAAEGCGGVVGFGIVPVPYMWEPEPMPATVTVEPSLGAYEVLSGYDVADGRAQLSRGCQQAPGPVLATPAAPIARLACKFAFDDGSEGFCR